MKLSVIIPLSSLLLAGFVSAESVSTTSTTPASTTKNTTSTPAAPSVNDLGEEAPQLTTAYVEARLKTITVTDFNIEKAPLSKALDYLDALVEPHGLQILYRPVEGRKEPTVNLKTRSLSMSRNLSLLAAQGGYECWVDNGIIMIGLPEADEALVTAFIPIHNSTVRRFVATERAK